MASTQDQVALVVGSLKHLVPRWRLATILKLLPRVGKWLVCILFLLNMRSWPLVWHFRIFRPVFAIRLSHLWLRIRICLKPRGQKVLLEDQWLDRLAPVGKNPFTLVVPYKTYASIDDSDFNGHLSNSSYAKILDGARFKAALVMFPVFFRPGGWMPLAATHYHFIREIPMFSSYEVLTSIACWDQKWLYLVSKIVTKTSDKKKKRAIKPTSPPSDQSSSENSPPSTSTPPTNGSTPDTENALKAVAAGLAQIPEGMTLNTIVVSQLCFKIGRITVPPSLAIAMNGLTADLGHSLENPHDAWTKSKEAISRPNGGSPKKLKKLMEGGWRDVPESERWWDQVLSGEIEAQRVRNLELVEGLRKGLDNARTL